MAEGTLAPTPSWGRTQLAREALRAYPPRLQGDMRIAARSGNSTWRVTAPAGVFALRLYRPGRWQAPQIETEHLFMRHLARGLPVELPRRGRDGQTVQGVIDPHTGEPVYVALFPWVPGRHHSDRLLPRHVATAGHFLAALHQYGKGFRGTAPRMHLQRHHMLGNVAMFCRREWSRLFPHAAPLNLSEACQRAAATWAKLAPATGYLHGDFHWGNFKVAGGVHYPVDFDDCGMGPLAYDLAVLAYWTEPRPGLEEPITILTNAYNEVAARPVSPEEVHFFVWVRNLWSLAWILARPEQYTPSDLWRDARYHVDELGISRTSPIRPMGRLA